MKNFSFTLFLLISSFLIFHAKVYDATITCGAVDSKALSCVKFAQGTIPTPPAACCAGLKQLAGSIRSPKDKQDICNCLKTGVKGFAGVQDKYLSQLPKICGINVGFPVSLNTNCAAIH